MEKVKLRDKIRQDINQALKKQEKQKLDCLRFFWAQIQNREIEKGREQLTDKEVVKLINTQIKNSEESLSFFEKGKREDLIKKTKEEIEILRVYLPRQLSEEELKKEVTKIIKQNPSISQLGPLIGLCIKSLTGKADNKRIAQMVMRKLKS